ncbi:MAG: T9SS type A sorting domain-containing protein [Ignavibacteriota bacterium]
MLITNEVRAQQDFQLLITSYDNDRQAVSFCGQDRKNEIQVDFGLANLFYPGSDSLVIDSIRYQCDKNVFSHANGESRFVLNQFAIFSGPVYNPYKVGIDTLTVIGYYGAFFSKAQIICHATPSPSLGLAGNTRTTFEIGGGNSVDMINYLLQKDTMFDYMNNGFAYIQADVPQSTGSNKFIELKNCGPVVIDTMYTVGDFSEFEFINIPTLPFTMPPNQSYQINYKFTPKIIGKQTRDFVIHTTDGKYLVWRFIYTVRSKSGVSADNLILQQLYTLFPNPAINSTLLQWKNEKFIPILVRVYNSIGQVVKNISVADQITTSGGMASLKLDLSDLSKGEYNLAILTRSKVYLLKLLVVK